MNESIHPSEVPPVIPARSGPPPFAKVVMAIAVLGIGAATGWWITSALDRGEQSQRGTPKAPTTWSFQAVSAERMCRPGGKNQIRTVLMPAKTGPLPARLRDHMPNRSPIPPFQAAYDSALSELTFPWDKVLAFHRVRAGYARTFNSPSQPGGFTVYAYEFPGERDALAGAIDAYRMFVCDLGADPALVHQQPGIAVGIRPSDTVAWWVHRRRLIEVNYSTPAEGRGNLTAALKVLMIVWGVGDTDQPQTSTA